MLCCLSFDPKSNQLIDSNTKNGLFKSTEAKLESSTDLTVSTVKMCQWFLTPKVYNACPVFALQICWDESSLLFFYCCGKNFCMSIWG